MKPNLRRIVSDIGNNEFMRIGPVMSILHEIDGCELASDPFYQVMRSQVISFESSMGDRAICTALNACDSDIEKTLLCAIHSLAYRNDTIEMLSYAESFLYPEEAPSSRAEKRIAGGFGVFLWPQFQVGKYRADFRLVNKRYEWVGPGNFDFESRTYQILIECDGHDFHERTKEQAARDKKRDRFLQSKGWQVFRFTGSEIYNDPIACAREALGAVKLVVETE